MTRPLLSIHLLAFVWLAWPGMVLRAQLPPDPVPALPNTDGLSQPTTGVPTSGAQPIPSLESSSPSSNLGAGSASGSASLGPKRTGGAPALPTKAGQYWEQYDLRPYTKELTSVERPHQAIVDWILRDTGTDVWFTEPFGFINADRDTLRVYHNEQMHKLVRQSYERFVNGTTVPQLYGMQLIAIGNPNWRTRAHTLLRSVPAQSAGVQAFLATKENKALLMAMLRGRSDYRELANVSVTTYNGQPQVLEQLRTRNFVREFQAVQSWPPYLPMTGEIQEGYRLQISPLMNLDKTIDIVIKCHIDQVEKLSNVTLDLPLPNGQVHSGQIQVPQVASWRLHERFRWPADDVLVLSCGVVASPQAPANNTLLGQGTSLIGLDRILPQPGDRADALLVIEHRGDAQRAGATAQPASGAVQTGLGQAGLGQAGQVPVNPLTRGRY